jgi:hypothetical protein
MFCAVARKVTKYITDSCRQCGIFPRWMVKGASGLKSDQNTLKNVLRFKAFFLTRSEVGKASRLTLLSLQASRSKAGTACLQ